jgi:hypothetical protein
MVCIRQKCCILSRSFDASLLYLLTFSLSFNPFFVDALFSSFFFLLENKRGKLFSQKVDNASKKGSAKRCRHTPLRVLYLDYLCFGLADSILVSECISRLQQQQQEQEKRLIEDAA